MNPLLIKAIAGFLLIAAIGAGLTALHHHVFEQGVMQERDRRDKIDAANTIKAQTLLAAANEKVRVAQASLTETILLLSDKQRELNDAKTQSAALESDLRDSRKWMLARGTIIAGHSAGQPANPAPATLDQGTEVTVRLDPAIAAELANIAATGDSAITRLNACVASYEAVESSINSIASDAH